MAGTNPHATFGGILKTAVGGIPPTLVGVFNSLRLRGGGFVSLRLSLASIHEPRYTFFTTLEAAAGRNVAASCMKEHMRQVLLVVREEPGASLLPFSH